MPKNCSIPGCTSRSDKRGCVHLSFHKLPADSDRRHQCLVSIRKPIKVSPYTYICSLHFKDNKKVSSNDIPTIFPWTNATTIRKSPANRPFTPPEPVTPPTDRKSVDSCAILFFFADVSKN